MTDLEEVLCIVKDVDDTQQMVESLIENVHRENLSPVEKGRATYQLFLLHDIDLKPSELRKTISRIRLAEDKEYSKSWKEIADICDLIGKSKSSIEKWIGAIAVSEEIQTAEVEKPKEEQMSEITLNRISTIQDEETRKKVYSKIEKEDMGTQKASRFVTVIKKLSPDAKEYALKPEADVSSSVMEKVTELPEEEQGIWFDYKNR